MGKCVRCIPQQLNKIRTLLRRATVRFWVKSFVTIPVKTRIAVVTENVSTVCPSVMQSAKTLAMKTNVSVKRNANPKV